MTDIKHETEPTSTACRACRQWERDMDGTTDSLRRERGTNKALLDALKDTLNMLRAAHVQCGIHHDGNKRVIKARAALAEADGRGV